MSKDVSGPDAADNTAMRPAPSAPPAAAAIDTDDIALGDTDDDAIEAAVAAAEAGHVAQAE